MRILTLRRMIAMGAIGVAYVHGKRGGDASFASIADTLRYVWSLAADKLGLDQRGQREQRAMPRHKDNPRVGVANGLPNDRTPRPSGG